MILVDTSVWIDFFSQTPHRESVLLKELLEQRQVVTCLPIVAEVLSGKMADSTREIVEGGMSSLTRVDLDWASETVWGKVIELASRLRYRKLPVCGLVDRMILLAGLEHGVTLWTIDKKLAHAAQKLGGKSHSG